MTKIKEDIVKYKTKKEENKLNLIASKKGGK